MASSSAQKPEELSRAMEHRTEGGAFFKAGDYGKAIREYHRSLMILRGMQNTAANMGLPGMSTEPDKYSPFQKDITLEIAKCFGNLAACILAIDTRTIEDYERASDYCIKVIEMPGNSPDLKTLKDKAKYRQVKSLKLMKKYEKAMELGKEYKKDKIDLGNLMEECKQLQKEIDRAVDAEYSKNMANVAA